MAIRSVKRRREQKAPLADTGFVGFLDYWARIVMLTDTITCHINTPAGIYQSLGPITDHTIPMGSEDKYE